MVVIVRPFPVSVEDLADRSRVPSVEELRPSCCPRCQQPSRPLRERLQIVGHGSYQRQVLGLGGQCGELLVWIRRFLCRGCGVTISLQPDELYPGRWYTGMAIVWGLVRWLLRGEPAWKVRQEMASARSTERDWRTLARWQRQLLAPLWSWLSRQLGFAAPARDRAGCRRRLARLLSLQGVRATSSVNAIQEVVRRLLVGTAHAGSVGWEMGRGPPSSFRSQPPRRASR